MFNSVFVAILAVVAVFLLRAWLRRSDEKARFEFDGWVDEVLSDPIANRISIDTRTVRAALRGVDDPIVVAAVEAAGLVVAVIFVRAEGRGECNVAVILSSSTGNVTKISRRMPLDAIPDVVREEFIKTGVREVTRPWHFPWTTR
jgi:hypothetical protein